MLSRRQLRIKVLQALYAFFQGEKNDLAVAERELFRSIEKVNELYLYILLFLSELAYADKTDASDLLQKFIPDEAELKAIKRLYELRFINALEDSKEFKSQVDRLRLSWQNNGDLIKKIFLEVRKSDLYRNFFKDKEADEKTFLLEMIKTFIEDSEAFQHHIDDESIFWSDDFNFSMHLVGRTIRAFYEKNAFELIPLYKDESDDKDFARKLFSQTILNNEEFEKAISERTKNWDVERIALMDILILKMALAELITFPNIPVKVSINEFIDISKDFSTPKSKQFVNGIIDKLAIDFTKEGRIVKTGRGLIS